MSRYYTNSLLIFSIFGGVVAFFLILSFEDVALSLFCGAITALLLSIIIPTVFTIGDRKFMPLKKEIAEPIVLDERVRYVVGEEIRLGFMVTTKHSLFIISTENKKPMKFEIKKNDIKKISISDDVFLNIFLDYDKCIRIFSTNCDELLGKLAAEGFGK